MKLFKMGLNAAFVLRKHGIRIVRELDGLPKEELQKKRKFIDQARVIYDKHLSQTKETVDVLNKKYEQPVFGKVQIWDMVQLLARCVDPSDPSLYCVSQSVHVLQIIEGMERDGIEDPDLFLSALVHDLGKVLLLRGEAPENVVCFNTPIGEYRKEIGLDSCVFQWNHEEFIYRRLKDYVPDHIAWLIRYHGISVPHCETLMNEQDRIYTERYLRIFQKYDKGTKSIYNLPKNELEKYRPLVEKVFPKPIFI
jgi:hypothetical protein